MTPTRPDDLVEVSKAELDLFVALVATGQVSATSDPEKLERSVERLIDATSEPPRFSVVHYPQGVGGDENPRSFLVVDGHCAADDGIAGCVILSGDWHSTRTAVAVFADDPDGYDAAAMKVSDEVRF